VARPPGRDRQNWGAAGTRHSLFKTGLSNTRLDLKKNTKDDIVGDLKINPKKIA
jgi:hypothetical protein